MNFYNVPKSLKDEETLLVQAIETIKKHFQAKCDAQNKLDAQERKDLLSKREWTYSLECDKNWYRLQKTAINPIEGIDDNTQWSIQFRIENGVLYTDNYGYNGKSWTIKELQQQGITEHTYESLSLLKW
jgi:hypothetical protein